MSLTTRLPGDRVLPVDLKVVVPVSGVNPLELFFYLNEYKKMYVVGE